MIFDKYIALIIESIERHASLILTSTKEDNKILQTEIGALGKELKDREALHEKILELEHENRLLEDSVEGMQEEFVSVSEKLEKAEEMNAKLKKEHKDAEDKISLLAEMLRSEELAHSQLEIDFEKSEDNNVQKGAKIIQLERKVKDTEVALENATQAHTEVLSRLLEAVKVYDKATVSMLNALLEKRSSVNERKAWEEAKEALKGWDTPKKKGRKKQS